MNGKLPVHVMPQVEGMDPLEQIMRAVEAELEVAGWDQSPSFWLMYGAEEYGMTLPFPVPDFVYVNPGEFLGVLVEKLQASPASLESLNQGIRNLLHLAPGHAEIKALGLFFEAFTLSSDAVPVAELAHHAKGHTISMHPDRVEERKGLFVTVEGDFAICGRQRGGLPEFSRLDSWDEQVRIQGRLPSALKKFLALMTLDMT